MRRMSESQKREAKRLVEILIEMGYLEKVYESYEHYKIELHTKEAWIRLLTEAIAMFQGEELEKALKKAMGKANYGRSGSGGRD